MTIHTRLLLLLQPNHEHLWKHQLKVHQQMDLFVCKTHECFTLMDAYIKDKQMKGKVWYMVSDAIWWGVGFSA